MTGEEGDPTPPEGVPVPSLLSGWSVLSQRRADDELAELAKRVQFLPGWQLANQGFALRREYEFAGEAEALRFLHFVATLASGSGWAAELELRHQVRVCVRVAALGGRRVRALELAAAAELHSAARRLGAVLTEPDPRPSPQGTRSPGEESN